MNKLPICFFLVVLFSAFALADTSIVPEPEWINDYQAAKAYAKALSAETSTLPEALHIYEQLQSQQPDDFLLSLEIEKARYSIEHPEDHLPNLSLVPRTDWISDRDARLTLAQVLGYHKKTYLEALEQYRILLKEEPHNVNFLLEMGTLFINLKLFDEAICLLETVQTLPKNDSQLAKLAIYENNLGYDFCSKQLFEEILLRNPDFDVLIQFANAMLSWGDFYQAENIYRQALCAEPDSIQIKLSLIDVLVGLQRLDEAEGFSYTQLSSSPQAVPFLEKIIWIKLQQKNYCTALSLVDQLILLKPLKNQYVLLRAEILYKLERYQEALKAFEILKNDQDYYAIAALGAGQCYLKTGNTTRAEIELQQASQDTTTAINARYHMAGNSVLENSFIENIILCSTTAQELQTWIDSYSQDGFTEPIRRLCNAAVVLDPDFFPTQINLAEAMSTELDFIPALEIYECLLDDFPENAKLLLARARVKSWNKDYLESIRLYEQLIALNPDNPVPKLEQARVAYWGKYYPLSVSLYERLLNDTEACDDWAMNLIHKKTWIEFQIQQLYWNNRIMHTLPFYQEELALEPASEIWKFGYAQALCSLGLCEDAIDIYRDILHNSPASTVTGIALEREENHKNISFALDYIYWQEKGYGDLDQIGRYQSDFMINIPLSCQQHIRLFQRYWIEHTFYDNNYHHAEGQSIEWDNRFNEFFLAAAGITYKQYIHRFGPTFTCFGNVTCNLWDYASLNLFFKKSDLITNFFNLEQTTQQRVWGTEINSSVTHAFSVNTLLEHIDYSDSNSAVHYLLGLNYAFTDSPRLLRLCLTGEYRNTAHLNIFIYSPSGQLLNIIFPYWAPQKYFFCQALLEWRHDYGWLEFCGAPVRYYSIKIAGGDDNQQNPFWEIKGEWQHEFYSHWKINVAAYIHRSPMWNAKGLWCTVCYEY